MALYKAFLYKYKRKDGTRKVVIRITSERVRAFVPTEIYIDEKYWNDTKGEVKTNHELHAVYNHSLRKQIFELQEHETKEILNNKNPTSSDIKKKDDQKIDDFFAYFEKRLDIIKQTRAENTWQRNYYSLVKLKKYVKDKLGNNTLPFKSITADFIENYYIYLLALPNVASTANKEMETISGILSHANKRGILKNYKNPFLDFKKKKSIPNIARLSIEEIDKLYFAPITGKWSLYRDIWMVQFYSVGMRISDTIMLKVSDISTGRLLYTMNKTGRRRSIPISGRLQDIFNQYAYGKNNEDYLFVKPLRSSSVNSLTESQTTQMNKIIKDVAEYCGIINYKQIRTHTARHSFANIAIKKIKDIFALRDLLGHSDVRITQKYAAALSLGDNDELTDLIYKF